MSTVNFHSCHSSVMSLCPNQQYEEIYLLVKNHFNMRWIQILNMNSFHSIIYLQMNTTHFKNMRKCIWKSHSCCSTASKIICSCFWHLYYIPGSNCLLVHLFPILFFTIQTASNGSANQFPLKPHYSLSLRVQRQKYNLTKLCLYHPSLAMVMLIT